jgi:hypothetical protein
MSDRVQGPELGKMAAAPGPPDASAVPRPPGVRSRQTAQPGAGRVQLQRPGTCRATVRDALEAALHGIRLGGRDRRFLGRLVHWDKREAGAVASLLWQARLAGRRESALSARQVEIVLGALEDAAAYRASGACAVGCWDCENIPGRRCADYARDADRARACTELAAQLAASSPAAGSAAAAAELQRLAGISGLRSRASSVAS